MWSELFTTNQLEQHARTMAGWHKVDERARHGADYLLPRLADNEAALRDAHILVTDAVRRGTRITPAAEWFIDNYHLIEEQIRTARRHLPRSYDRELPALVNAPWTGRPRVYDIALELIAHSHGRVDADDVRAFVGSYQTVQPLRLGELWAIPIMLRLALIENLRSVVSSITAGRRDRERAGFWVDQMLEVAASDPSKVVLVLASMVKEGPRLTNAFVTEFASRLQGQGPALLFPMYWLEHRLLEQGQTVEHVFQLVAQNQAAHQVAIGNSIGSLRFLGATDWRDFVEGMSVVERTLRTDPAEVYSTMDFSTRNSYRRAVETLAKKSDVSEEIVAQQAVRLAAEAKAQTRSQSGSVEGPRSHVGYYLIDEARPELENAVRMRTGVGRPLRRRVGRSRLTLYGGSVVFISAGLTGLLARFALSNEASGWSLAVAIGVLGICCSQVAIGIVHWAATLVVLPRTLPRLDFMKGIPSEHQTMVAVPALITDTAEIDDLLEALEIRFLANRDHHLSFALLSDFRDAQQATMPEDLELLARARAGIEALNTKYSTSGRAGGFFLFHRARRWNPREGVWMGWERKRGKLEEFNSALRGDTEGFDVIVGDVKTLQGVKFVISLDSDTQLPRESARALVGTMAHPLNRPMYDESLGRVVRGYTILQPRVAITMTSALHSRFAQLFAGDPGIDPYTRAVSDVYQDVFGEGSFVGKGIYDVDAFRHAIGGRLPENRILSHDLLEGSYARSGLVSDVMLFEDFPAAYATDVSRRRRWMRGDWQILPWLRARVPDGRTGRVKNPLSWLSQWKIVDNLRRSLVPVALLVVLLVGWLAADAAWFATLLVLAILLLPGLLNAGAELMRRPVEMPLFRHTYDCSTALGRQVLREIFALACLPYDAFIALSAIVNTGVRMLFTGRKLLQWRTAKDAERSARTGLPAAYARMWIVPVLAIAVVFAIASRNPGALAPALPVLALWMLAPGLTWWVSQPVPPEHSGLDASDLLFLRTLARRSWRFFETFVAEEDNHLPPDNFQEEPHQGVAHRTSPTNIGLCLTANLAAYDFGYLPAGELVARTALTLQTMDRLQRYRGHFFNWYDTRSLEPLRPMYISAVDSGNLAGHLFILASGLCEMAGHPILRGEIFSGIGDTIDGITEAGRDWKALLAQSQSMRIALRTVPATLSEAHLLLNRLGEFAKDLAVLIETRPTQEDLAWWVGALGRQVYAAQDELNRMAPWIALLPKTPLDDLASALSPLHGGLTLGDSALMNEHVLPAIDRAIALADEGHALLIELRNAVALGSERAALRLAELQTLADRCVQLCDQDYEFLYLRDRHLLAIGYNVVDHRLDAGCYDLLASEARLTSFVAIAQGKIPQEHWFRLGRLLTSVGERPSLLSWSGSMFEYLMPLLIMPTCNGTILDDTYRGVVDRQIEYGREHGVPWGVSESGYNKTDTHLTYQYRAFGVPGLGFKRGLGNDLVVAPYASAMALMVSPGAACANLRRMAELGFLGAYGFFEAVDYTPERLPRGVDHVTVRSYMAHHQAMAFLSLAHALCDKPMQRRFGLDRAFQATQLLLQERVPKTPPIDPHPADLSVGEPLLDAAEKFRVFTSPSTAVPEVHLLSNGTYHVALTNAGGGYSRWRNLAVTRWREDPTRDCWGSFCYLRDVGNGSFWSVAHQPTLKRADSYEAIYSQGRAEYRRRDNEIDTHVEISISPEDDIELRRVSLTNFGRSPRTIELTSFAEVVLAPPAADAAHPAFSNLFVQTELLRKHQAILCTRRPRSGAEQPPWMFHLMTVQGTAAGTTSYETGRAEFIGRGRSVEDPIAMHAARLTDSEGAVLDPIVAIRNTVVIAPDETVRIHMVTGISETRAGATALIEKYSDPHSADRVFELSWTHSQVLLRRLDATEADTQLYERLAGNVLYASPNLRAPRAVMVRNRRGQSALWPYGISGDLPIVLVRIADGENLGLLRHLVKAHAYWRQKGMAADLVIWNEDASGYRQVLQDDIIAMVASLSESSLLDRPGGIFVRRADQLSEEDKVLMQTAARLIVNDSDGSLGEQMNRRSLPDMPPRLLRGRERRHTPFGTEVERAVPSGAPIERTDLLMWNGLGGFTPDGREYVIITTPTSRTPAPWVNVLANPWFGSVVSESGGAYTWCENAHGYRLTPWHNDAVSDTSGEAFYLRDEDDGQFWSPTPLPAGGASPYTTRHGFGYSVFEHNEGGIESELQTFVAIDAPLKFMTFKIRNRSGRGRRLSLTGFFELVLGSNRSENLPHIVTEIAQGSGALFARNAYSSEFAERIAFLDCSEKQRTVSGDRLEFLGRNGSAARPACMTRARLSNRVGAGLDPCLAMQASLDLADGQEREIVFTFGSGRDLADARALVRRFSGTAAVHVALDGVWSYWNRTLGAVNVQTPDPALNLLANGWLLYQVLASRIWGRSGFYQSGGAFGFRDQLQDAMALVHTEPAILREQILRSASRQFIQGDVQHWWHPPTGRGVRTRISDDYLWLPHAVCRYVGATGDTGVLDATVHFLEGRFVNPEEDSYYDLPTRSESHGTVYEHCVRAIEHGLNFGEHGLPLMGSGDWNDGMNLVGDEGKGESVWLAFFLYDLLVRFAELSRSRKDDAFAERCRAQSVLLRDSIEQHGWDGEWYRRAYFDSGEPLGSASNPECQIDSLPQSWSVLSGAADPDRSRQALAALDRRLVKRDLGVIQLFDPPFDTSDMKPGYVRGYVPGVRENGGQYTHAAVWAVMAFAAAGNTERAWELFNLINPIRHGDRAAGIATYKVEPYVVAADVYTNPQHAGRGGWTWYTGSAGWMYRLVIESLLGIHREGERLRIAPLMPSDWSSFDVHYRYHDTRYHIRVRKRDATGAEPQPTRVVCDGIEQPDAAIALSNDGGEHQVEVDVDGTNG